MSIPRFWLKKSALLWMIPILLMAIITPFTPYLDLKFARRFYLLGLPGDHFYQTPFIKFVYDYFSLPAEFAAVLAALAYGYSFLIPRFRYLRPYALYLTLTMAVGAGLIVHVVLKDHWGRPRPRQVIEFGGIQEFRPYYKPNIFNQPEQSKSFSCGHCTMGFYFFSFIILGLRLKRKWLFYAGIFLTLILGIPLSYGRMAQGGHFFSDVLMSALIMWLTALALDRVIFSFEEHERTD